MPEVKLIANPGNRGFPAAVNQGIAAATGRQVLLLNNDVIVTTGWLRRMLEALEGTTSNNPKSEIESPKCPVGLVGPLTNCASGETPTPSENPKSKIENPKSPLGYVMQVHCPGPGDDGRHNVTVVDHVKLFRNLPELRFEGRIHEQVLPSIRRLGGEVRFTEIFVVHAGADHSPATRRAKLKRDFQLLKLELREQPDHPFTLFNLGMTYADAGRHRRAIHFLRRSLSKSNPAQSQVRKAYALLAASYLSIGKVKSASRTCRQALKLFPNDPELLFRAGLTAHRLGRLSEAEGHYLAVLAGQDERHFSSIDRAIAGFKTRQNLAIVYTERGDLKRAEEQWREIIAEVPDYADGWLGLFDNLLAQTDVAGAADLLHRLRTESNRYGSLRAVSLIAHARLCEARGDVSGALAAASAAVREYPADTAARELCCRLLFQHGGRHETEQALAELTRLSPRNAAAWHNLGLVRLQRSDWRGAVTALESSLRLRSQAHSQRISRYYHGQRLGLQIRKSRCIRPLVSAAGRAQRAHAK